MCNIEAIEITPEREREIRKQKEMHATLNLCTLQMTVIEALQSLNIVVL